MEFAIINLTRQAAKAIVIALENVGLDTNQYALQLGMKDDNITMAFMRIDENPHIHFSHFYNILWLESRGLPSGITIDVIEHDGKQGLIFIPKEKDGSDTN